MEKNTTEQCPDIKPTVKTTKTTKPRTPVNTGIDKREAQNNRETIKTILLLSIGVLEYCMVLLVLLVLVLQLVFLI